MINMAGIDFGKGPEGGIYLMGHDTTRAQVGRGGGGMLRNQHLRGWDGGRFIPGDVKTTADAVAATGLDWLVSKHPVILTDSIMGVGSDGSPEVIGWQPRLSDTPPATGKGQQANTLPHGGFDIARQFTLNVRQDNGTVLGVVGPQWQGPQNHEAFTFVDDLVDSGDAKWLGGGEQAGGQRVWMCAQLDRTVALGGDEDEMSIPLCFLSNGWDGYTPLTVTVAPYRMACLNGQTIPLEGYVRSWKVRHTTNHADRLQAARKVLELSVGYFDEWAAAMEKLMVAKLTKPAPAKLVKVLFPDAPLTRKDDQLVQSKVAQANVEKKRDAVLTIYRDSPTLQNLGSTKYRLLNAVTEYADWHVECKSEDQVLRSAQPSVLKDAAYKLLTV
jgi:phage/plasmid-like protein (TIGR03299 family)